MSWLSDPAAWTALAALLTLEVVLGVDNVIFISILASKLPADQQDRARLVGLLAAGGVRVVFLLAIGWIISLKKELFTIGDSGQTPAKRLLKLRVIDASSLRPVGFGKMFWVRGLLAGIVAQFAILFTLGTLLFMPFWDKRKQNIWDKVSSTYVVNDPNDVWNTKPNLTTP